MEDLLEIYKRMEYLRNNGVKMKEMADQAHMPASVLSSLYSAVLPAYIGTLKKGSPAEEALDHALGQVNNVSKKRLLGNLTELKECLFGLEPAPAAPGLKDNPFLNLLNEEMPRSAQEAYNYSGIYISYSLSSSSNTLKVEPYLITASEKNDYVRVVHMSAYNTTHTGVAIFSNHQTAYLMFNEREMPQMALFTIYLQGPLPQPGLQPQPHRPAHRLRQALGQHRPRGLFGTERPAGSPRGTDGGTAALLQLHLPAGRLHQDLHRPFAPAGRQ